MAPAVTERIAYRLYTLECTPTGATPRQTDFVVRSRVTCAVAEPPPKTFSASSCAAQKSARNIEFLEVNYASAVRIYDVLRADRIVVEEDALAYLQEFYA